MTVQVKKKADLDDWPDDRLIAEARRGGGTAFATIMRRHNRRLYRAARGIVRDDVEAEDVVQEAYVKAYAALAEFQGAASLATWLTRIVINEALGRLRRRREMEDLDVLDRGGRAGLARVIALPGVTVVPDPEQALARAEVRRLLRRALDERLASALTEAFPFDGARCAGLTDKVLRRLGLDAAASPP